MNGNVPRDSEGRALTRQEQLLLLIESRYTGADGLTGLSYVPRVGTEYIDVGREHYGIGSVGGAGDAQVLKAMERKGLIEWTPVLGKYACKITEDGLLKAQEIA